MKNTCSIYVIKNILNDKVYVGQTWTSIKERFRKHKTGKAVCRKLRNAFSKYGVGNFYIELLLVCHTQEIVDYWEIFFIKKLNAIQNGYNIKAGGSKGKQSEETKIRIGKSNSIALKGHKPSEVAKEKLSLALTGIPKPPRSIEHITNLTSARRRNSKIDKSIINLIRQDFVTGLFTHKQLSIKYNINRRTITDIVNFKIWK